MIVAPGKYIQGPGELDRLAEHTGQLGAHAFVIADEFVMNLTGDRVTASYAKAGAAVTMERFQGEITQAEIERLTARCKESQADVVVGIGGGKTLDSAKAVAYYCGNLPAVVVPTVASTDAPCSALSVIYKEDGSFERYLFLPSNPAVVVVDTAIIANAPVRLLVAGMGDALATYFEARAAQRAHKLNIVGGHGTQAAMALARLCYDTLLQEGIKAKAAAEAHVITEALERIVEANTYLSGLGFESCGLAGPPTPSTTACPPWRRPTAPTTARRWPSAPSRSSSSRTQPLDEIEEVIEFCLNVGLPVTLADLGVHTVREEQIRRVAELSCAEGETIFNMPFEVTPEKVYAAILTADRLGHLYKGG